jgi:hypothetical protein
VHLVWGRDEVEVTGGSIVTGMAKKEVDILETDLGSVIVIGRVDVLARVEQEEKTCDLSLLLAMKWGSRDPKLEISRSRV